MRFNIAPELKNRAGIYIIRNSVNDKVYVGSAENFGRRFILHTSRLRTEKYKAHPLQVFVNENGLDKLVFGLLEIVEKSQEALFKAEQKWLDHFNASDREKGFNVSPTAGSIAGAKMALSPEQKAKRGIHRLGIKHTEEARRRISESQAGKQKKPFTPEQRQRQIDAVTAANKERGMSDEHKQKLSLARKGKKRDPEIGAKIVAALKEKKAQGHVLGRPKGIKLTDEQKPSSQ